MKDDPDFDELFFDRIVEKVFVGESPKNKMTEFSGGYGDDFRGNSLLLHICGDSEGSLEYVFIGWKIYSFEALSEIVQYVSPVGNSDVPYPYAIDTKNRAYLLKENVIVQLTEKEVSNIPSFDPYNDCYYEKHLITRDISVRPPQEPIIKNFRNIEEFYIGDAMYTMDYDPFPEKDYDRLIRDIGSPLSVVLTDDTKEELSKKEYINMMDEFGKLMKFQPLKKKDIIHERLW
uniref:Uncharacterized protein n=1 Tax=Marseillevirus LCMAC101 TaxID=2506602 RepID=A0A481YTP4_9VIRU|nr:MAG: hypothetical protein LCMAC101_04690 [Marseillevirus LCMAC101]